MGKPLNTVRLDVEKLKDDMRRLGVTPRQVGEIVFGYRTAITGMMNRVYVSEENVHRLERALFKPEGTYCLPVGERENPKLEYAPVGDGAVTKDNIEDILEALERIEAAIKSNTTWAARLYAVWTNQDEQKS